jgi:AbrB family looped-hinge helix DNA binding protein
MVTHKKDMLIFGSVKVGERGQIVIPKDAREEFDINPGDILLVLRHGDKGIKIMKPDLVREIALKLLDDMEQPDDKDAI